MLWGCRVLYLLKGGILRYCVGGFWDRTQDFCNFGTAVRRSDRFQRFFTVLLPYGTAQDMIKTPCQYVLQDFYFDLRAATLKLQRRLALKNKAWIPVTGLNVKNADDWWHFGPALFVSDLEVANKKLFIFKVFCILLFEGTFTSFFTDKVREVTKQ